MLVQAAQHVGSHPGPLGHFFRKLAHRKTRNVAVVATARKLVVIAWNMLTNNEPYRYAIPKSTETKLARVRVIASDGKRRTGPQKGIARPKSYGSGVQTRALPSLEQVCEKEGLPPPKPLSEGEKKTVKAARAQKFVRQIHTPRRVIRKTPSADTQRTANASSNADPNSLDSGGPENANDSPQQPSSRLTCS